jgi:hypothetical protein
VSRRREWAALAVCLAVVAAIGLATGDRADSVPVAYDDVAVGETGVSSEFAARVLDVQLTRAVQRDEFSDPITTDAAFAVVALAADARTGTVTFSRDVWLVTADGVRYAPRPEVSFAQPSLVEAGFTAAGTFVFQVPPDRLAGARLLVEPTVATFEVHDVTVRVDLGLDDVVVSPDPVVPDAPSAEVTR